ncbi:MAG: hypothetical protein K8S94_17405 [Planctomycetia bacterium]|nr:hypothetical protein [Planctomycetia bacterium]
MRTVTGAAALAWLLLSAFGAARGESAAEATTRTLLERLDDRQMPDVMLWVIERAATDPAISDALKGELPFLRATALVGTSRTESDTAKRAALLDEAEKSIDAFLATDPAGDLAIAAYTQKGNLLIERGRGKLDQAKRPGQDAKKLSAEGAAFFDSAIKSLKGTVKPDQKEIAKVNNAEDAVLRALREVDGKIDALKAGGKTKGDGPAKLTATQQKEVDRLEELQTQYRAKLLSTRLMTGAALFEKSKAFSPGSKEATAAIDESTAVFKSLAEKYGTTAAGIFARYYWGRNSAAIGKHELAAETLAPVVVIDDKSPLAVSLRAKAINTSLECWLAMAAAEKDAAKATSILQRVDDSIRKFVLTPAEKLPGRKLDAEWLGLKYRAATALDAWAGKLDAKDKQAKGILQRDAKKLATEVATANKDFAKEARELAAKLGKDLPEGSEEKDFATLVADARVSFAAMQEKQAEAKKFVAEGKAAEAEETLKRAGVDRDAAAKLFEEAIKAGEAEKQPDEAAINSARSMLTFLYYDAKRFADAATLGAMLTERYPNALGSRQAARVALASLQQLGLQPDPAVSKDAKAKLVAVATIIGKTWPAEAEGADAFSVLLNVALESRDAAAIAALLEKFPADSPRRAEFAMRAGTGLRREVQEARKLDASVRPDETIINGWNAAAKAAIDEGLASLEQAATLPAGVGGRIAAGAALARVQMALDDGDREAAGRILEHKVFGPWTLVLGGDPALVQGQFAEGTLTVALRHFIETEQLDKAQAAMDALEKAAGQGEEASAKLTGMYLSMGRDLQAQLENLGGGDKGSSPEVRERAGKILAGFEKFLDGVAKRDKKISSQIWVATTYYTLGSGKGTGAVVPKSKAEQYLDRAAEAYARLLSAKDDPGAAAKDREDIGRFEPSIRLKMAGIFKERGKWDAAQEQIDWILADTKRQNSLEIQLQAAELLELAGRAALAAGDSAKGDALLREAAAGRKAPPVVIWGWGGIANKLSRQAFSAADEKAMKAREQFFEARLHVADTLLTRAKLGGAAADREKRLDTAKTAIAMTRKLYPDLGGEAFQKRFEKLLREVQKEQGAANPGGFSQLDQEAGAAAQPAPAGAAP